MAGSIFDSPLHAELFPTGETGRLFSDSAAVRAMLLTEGALAKAQGAMGIIPEVSAAAIQRASLEVAIDPGALTRATGQNGVSVPGLVAAFRAEMNAPEHAQYVHWGATSQDILDTGLMLRLRQALLLAEDDLKTLITALGEQADAHAGTVMPARTYSQHATPSTWGAVLAQWGNPLIDAAEALAGVREGSLWVSLSGASGTGSALGPKAAALRAALAQGLGLNDPQRSWHTDRGPILRIADWMAGVVTVLSAIGQTLIGLSASDIGEVRFDGAGASSTMPQKQNPVAASALVALGHQMTGLRASLSVAGAHQHQRDGAAWFAEWMVLPQIVLTTASALQIAKGLSQRMTPDTAQMHAATEGLGLMLAEALSFALAEEMPRPEAQTVVKELCQRAMAQNRPLADLVRSTYPNVNPALLDPVRQTGDAQSQARTFASRARGL